MADIPAPDKGRVADSSTNRASVVAFQRKSRARLIEPQPDYGERLAAIFEQGTPADDARMPKSYHIADDSDFMHVAPRIAFYDPEPHAIRSTLKRRATDRPRKPFPWGFAALVTGSYVLVVYGLLWVLG